MFKYFSWTFLHLIIIIIFCLCLKIVPDNLPTREILYKTGMHGLQLLFNSYWQG